MTKQLHVYEHKTQWHEHTLQIDSTGPGAMHTAVPTSDNDGVVNFERKFSPSPITIVLLSTTTLVYLSQH